MPVVWLESVKCKGGDTLALQSPLVVVASCTHLNISQKRCQVPPTPLEFENPCQNRLEPKRQPQVYLVTASG
jgi:hypothetical protein